jgi:hypothetical protein
MRSTSQLQTGTYYIGIYAYGAVRLIPPDFILGSCPLCD